MNFIFDAKLHSGLIPWNYKPRLRCFISLYVATVFIPQVLKIGSIGLFEGGMIKNSRALKKK